MGAHDCRVFVSPRSRSTAGGHNRLGDFGLRLAEIAQSFARMSPWRRWLAILCALAGAAALALAVQGSDWWTVPGQVGVGTVSSNHCYGGECTHTSLGWAGGSQTWVRAGAATYAGGLLAALLLVALAGARTAGSSGRLTAASAAVATLCAAVVGAVFVTSRPVLAGDVLTLARGVPLFAAGVVLAVIAIGATLWPRSRTTGATG